MAETIRVANVMLQDNSGSILFLKRAAGLKQPNLWCLPGGMVDLGETPRLAAIRELEEETGITIAQITLTTSKEFLVHMAQEKVRIYSYLASLVAPTTVVIDPCEHVDYSWLSPDSVQRSSNLLPGVPSMMASILGLEMVGLDLTIPQGVTLEVIK